MVNTDLNDEALRAELLSFLRMRPDLNKEHLAQFTTVSGSTVGRFLRGESINGATAELRDVLARVKSGDILGLGGPGAISLTEDQSARPRRVAKRGAFYETQTVKRIAETIDYCAEHCAIGVITADFGVGKTEALKAWRRNAAGRASCVVFEFDEFSSTNKVDFVCMIARQFGLDAPGGTSGGGRVFRDVCAHLRANPCVLIFDQCETVRPRVMQVIRQIHDRTADAGVGMVLLAQQVLLARMMGGKTADLGALTSRVGVWTALGGITRAEMASIVKREGVEDVEDAAFDLWYRAVGGSMRRLMKSLDLLKSKHAGKRITEHTITGVAGMLWGMKLAGAEVG